MISVLEGVSSSPTVVVCLILGFILVLGLFIEGIPILIIFTPVMIPVIQWLGIDPVYFGVVLVMAVVIGSVTPPVGILTYICCAIAGLTISQAAPRADPVLRRADRRPARAAVFPDLIMTMPNFFGHE